MIEVLPEKVHISFSEAYQYSKCPYNHHLNYIIKQKREDSIYTIFGTLMENSIEDRKVNKNEMAWLTLAKGVAQYLTIENLESAEPKTDQKLKEEIRTWIKSAFRIYKEILPWLDEKFPGYEVVSFQERLFEQIPDHKLKFKGYIDLVIKHDETYHIIDFKTTTAGWFRDTLEDTQKMYQVVLYKYFFCKSRPEIDPEKVNVHYLLLKRKPPKDKSAIEIISQTSGDKRLGNAIQWLKDVADGIEKGVRVRIPATCKFCSCDLSKKK